MTDPAQGAKYMAMDIGDRIRSIRLQKGIKATDVANQVGVGKSYLSLLEHGKRRLSADLVAKIAKVLGVPVATLYGEDVPVGEPVPPSGSGKHLRCINGRAVRKCLRPHLGAKTDAAVELLELWMEAPEEVRKQLEARSQAGRSRKPSRRRTKRGKAA